jgi:hypothetical protein
MSLMSIPPKKPPRLPKPNRFLEDARAMGLDNDQSVALFESAMSKIAPPKQRGGSPNAEPCKDDKS